MRSDLHSVRKLIRLTLFQFQNQRNRRKREGQELARPNPSQDASHSIKNLFRSWDNLLDTQDNDDDLSDDETVVDEEEDLNNDVSDHCVSPQLTTDFPNRTFLRRRVMARRSFPPSTLGYPTPRYSLLFNTSPPCGLPQPLSRQYRLRNPTSTNFAPCSPVSS